jgi:phosphoribosylglycinamide formyltransferase-1
MIDQEWIDSLENGGIQDITTRPKESLISDFVRYYKNGMS